MTLIIVAGSQNALFALIKNMLVKLLFSSETHLFVSILFYFITSVRPIVYSMIIPNRFVNKDLGVKYLYS